MFHTSPVFQINHVFPTFSSNISVKKSHFYVLFCFYTFPCSSTGSFVACTCFGLMLDVSFYWLYLVYRTLETVHLFAYRFTFSLAPPLFRWRTPWTSWGRRWRSCSTWKAGLGHGRWATRRRGWARPWPTKTLASTASRRSMARSGLTSSARSPMWPELPATPSTSSTASTRLVPRPFLILETEIDCWDPLFSLLSTYRSIFVKSLHPAFLLSNLFFFPSLLQLCIFYYLIMNVMIYVLPKCSLTLLYIFLAHCTWSYLCIIECDVNRSG